MFKKTNDTDEADQYCIDEDNLFDFFTNYSGDVFQLSFLFKDIGNCSSESDAGTIITQSFCDQENTQD